MAGIGGKTCARLPHGRSCHASRCGLISNAWTRQSLQHKTSSGGRGRARRHRRGSWCRRRSGSARRNVLCRSRSFGSRIQPPRASAGSSTGDVNTVRRIRDARKIHTSDWKRNAIPNCDPHGIHGSGSGVTRSVVRPGLLVVLHRRHVPLVNLRVAAPCRTAGRVHAAAGHRDRLRTILRRRHAFPDHRKRARRG
jgi:hypothetical protein